MSLILITGITRISKKNVKSLLVMTPGTWNLEQVRKNNPSIKEINYKEKYAVRCVVYRPSAITILH